ncbi:DUF5420 family protein [Mannheimia sp. AT1]|uniref:DUF5420 family protein n=1 Tax=Mannheimia cairinae TaxID=3025936 RepID=A0ABT5MQH8_9PAST|nr:DUF5420 family protein [Mannheimia cairinae]MDD0823734.1 DUF5420 family protein [Mannheimia cairinae]MDD0825334.1 DUF5420 family protein [Mannheimia cairinae]
MKYRFFKGDVTQEPLKNIYADYQVSKEERKDKLNAILEKYPFNDGLISGAGWFHRMVSGIACKATNISQVLCVKGFKVSKFDDEFYLVKPDKRYKKGKELAEDFKAINEIYEQHRDFSPYILKRLNMLYFASDFSYSPTSGRSYLAVAGICENTLLVKVPMPIDKNDEPFPDIAEGLVEIKESEFLAIQGK